MCFGAKQNPVPTGGTPMAAPAPVAPVAPVSDLPASTPTAPAKATGVSTKTTAADTGLNIPMA